MNIVICGGSVIAAQEISEQIRKIDSGKHIVMLKSFAEAIEMLSYGAHFDLLLCDIDGSPSSSLKYIQHIKEKSPHSLIVLMSSNGTLIMECSEYVWRYEIKPLSASKIKYVLARANNILAPQIIVLPVKSNSERLVLNIHHIVYFEIFDKTGIVHTTDKKSYSFRSSLTKVEEELTPGTFYRPHKSFLVNIEYIRYITENEIYMLGDIIIPLSRNRKNTLFKLLSNYSNIIFA